MIARLAAVVLMLAPAVASAQEPVAVQQAHAAESALSAFDPLIGKAWRGASITDPAIIDEIRWERVAGDQAIRSVHAVNGGAYAGETLITVDKATGKLVTFYATNGSFYTTGTAEVRGPGAFVFEQQVHGLDGIDQVQATTTFENGVYAIRSRHHINGQWVETGGFDYRAVD
jgi:hypothetical protein